eukprot:TRINITY_DN13557_c0_g1_i1.p1 TRINITY_DN13557_c0_g1~~TRINITY_DN13557_c0_g1_i1.p1  ORF type:complete len:281 (-),score=68.93 TRINITY_DN13557_c0_g1_i1:76-918(-)
MICWQSERILEDYNGSVLICPQLQNKEIIIDFSFFDVDGWIKRLDKNCSIKPKSISSDVKSETIIENKESSNYDYVNINEEIIPKFEINNDLLNTYSHKAKMINENKKFHPFLSMPKNLIFPRIIQEYQKMLRLFGDVIGNWRCFNIATTKNSSNQERFLAMLLHTHSNSSCIYFEIDDPKEIEEDYILVKINRQESIDSKYVFCQTDRFIDGYFPSFNVDEKCFQWHSTFIVNPDQFDEIHIFYPENNNLINVTSKNIQSTLLDILSGFYNDKIFSGDK